MKALNKTEKVVKWANNDKTRNVSHMMTELNMVDEKQLMNHLNKLRRDGRILFTRTGQSVAFAAAQEISMNIVISYCMKCHKYKHPDGEWYPNPPYIHRDDRMDISHTYCPTCLPIATEEFFNPVAIGTI